jgi:phytoene dehydrogenase-like protein
MGGCNLTPDRYPVIVVGAGIGGLSTAAMLSLFGIDSLLVEHTAFLGGRCSTRLIRGEKYEIGALYLGGGVFDHLRQTFGLKSETVPVRCGVKIGKNLLPFPLGLRTLWALRRSGVSWLRLARFFYESRCLSHDETFRKYESAGDLLDILLPDPVMHQFFEAILGVLGASVYRLPSRYLSRSHPAVRYKGLKPEAFREGNGALATTLFELAKDQCRLLLQTEAHRILVADRCVRGIETNRGSFYSNVVVSNAGLRPTVLSLTSPGDWPSHYYEEVQKTRETLRVVNIFLTFSEHANLPREYAVFFVPNEISREFELLEKGVLPELSSYILHVPSNLESDGRKWNRATLQFYYPRITVPSEQLKNHVHRILTEGLEKLCDGFSRGVMEYEVYDPIRYEREFGIVPYVFGVSADLNSRRFSIQTPVKGLFCVGDSVGPEGPCVPQAMESGFNCARIIAAKLR